MSTSKTTRPPATIAGSRPAKGCSASWARNRSARAARSNSSMPRAIASPGVLGVDRARIGGVDVGELAGLVARPDRRRQRLDQRAHGVGVVDLTLEAAGELGELALDAAHVLEAQDRAPADHLALGLDRAACERRQRHREFFAALAQRRRPRSRSPARRRARARGRRPARGAAHRRSVTRLMSPMISGSSSAAGPGHQDLRLRAQQRVDAVDLGAAGDDLVARGWLRSRRGAARVRTSRIAATAAKHRTDSVIAIADDLVAVEQREGVEIGLDQRRAAGRGVGGRSARLSSALDRRARDRRDAKKRLRSRRRCGIRRAADEPDGPRRRSGSCPAYPIAPIRRIPGARVASRAPSLEHKPRRQPQTGSADLPLPPHLHGRPRINGL